MRKKIICVIFIVVLVFTISGILYYKTFISSDKTAVEHNESVSNQDVAVNEAKSDNDIIEISVDSVKGIPKHIRNRQGLN